MPSPRWRKVLRDVWLHKPRTALVVLAIAVGIVGAGAVLDTWALLRRVTRDGYLATNPAAATLRTDAIDDAVLALARAVPGVADAQARRTALGGVMVQGTWRTALLFAPADLHDIRIGKVDPLSGRWPPDGGIVIEHSSLEFSGAALGDSVMVRVGDGPPRLLPVVGVARDKGLAPGWMEHVVYAFLTPATLAELGLPASPDQLQITVTNGTPTQDGVRRVAVAVRQALERAGHRVTDIDVPVPGRHIHAGQMDSLLLTQGAFGVLALLLSGFLVVNLVAAMLTGQVREIGVMKAIGARQGQIARMYLGLALLLGLVACIIALPLAALLGRAYAAFAADLLNFDVRGVAIPRGIIALQLVVGALLPVVAAAVPVVRGCGISVSDALRDFGIDGAGSRRARRLTGRLPGASRPLLLSLRNAFRRRQRMALTLITLAMGGAVFLGALNLRASIRDSVGQLFGSVMRYDVALRFAEPHAADSLESATRGIAGVARAEAWSGARAGVLGADGLLGGSFPLIALPAASPMVGFPMEAGRWPAESDTAALVVNRRLVADDSTLTVGTEVTLVIRGRPDRWRIAGVVESGPAPSAYTTRRAMARALGDTRAGTVVVVSTLRGTASQSELIQRLRNELGARGFAVESSQLMEASRQVLEDHMLMVAGFLVIMSQLMIVVGGLGLASTMSLAVLERTREIGVLRAIGARHGAILAMVQIEGLVIGVLSWLLAIPLSLPMSVILERAFGRIMLRVPVTFVPEPSGVLLWLGVVLVVSVLACAWPSVRATRIPTAAALAYE